MIRLHHFCAGALVALCTLSAYAQYSVLPTEILAKLNEKAVQMFPDDLKAQDKWITDSESAYLFISEYPTLKGNEEIFASIKKRGAEKFPMDFISQQKFMESMVEGLMLIDAYDVAFPDKAEFKKMKAAVLAENPDDYKKAAADFEKQSLAIMEISAIAKPENLSKDEWDAFKLGLSLVHKGDYEKQKEILTAFSGKMMEFYSYQESQRLTTNTSEQGPSEWQKQEDIKNYLGDAVLMVQGDKAIGYITTIQNRDVVIFPSEAYDARSLSITNKFDERVTFDEVFACKDVPVTIAFVKDAPESVKKVKIANEQTVRELLNKNALLYSFELRNDSITHNKISAFTPKALNLANKLNRATIPGAILTSTDSSDIVGMVVNQTKVAEIGNLSNQSDAKFMVEELNRENPVKIMLRIDKLANWERIDPHLYIQQAEALETLRKRNEDFMALFTASRFSNIEDNDAYRATYERFKAESRTKFEKSGQERMVRDMITEILGNMRRDIQKLDPSQMYVTLQDAFEFNLKLRHKMMETLETAVKNKTYMNYYFDDMKPKGK